MCDDVLHGRVALAMLEPAFLGGGNHGAGDGVGEVLFQACRKAQDLVFAPPVGGNDAREFRLCLGECARLIEYDGVRFGERFEVFRAFDHDAGFGSIAHGGHYGDRARELQRT